MIDLRSDTVTRPSPAMRDAMAKAEVGDDVFGDDPTVRALEHETAELVGKEAALFVPSGTMGNQIAIALHCRPGDEVIVGEGAHVVYYESGAGAALSGVQFAVAGAGGLFDADAMVARIHPDDFHAPRTSLVCVENTHNRAGGRVFPQSDVVAIAGRARAHGLALHLDGARIWNAAIATGLSPAELAAPFDTVSVCFSKGLGAPVGSALCMPRALLSTAKRVRKRFGGAMRQAGIVAAGALHALRHNRGRLADDHAMARMLAERLAEVPGARVDVGSVETNIVMIDLDPPRRADAVVLAARELGLLVHASGPRRIRAVTHLDAGGDEVAQAAELLARAIGKVA